MLTLFIGGASSGKSELAEALARSQPGPRIYLATLSARDAESRARILRHRQRRAKDGYTTLEVPLGLTRLGADALPPGSLVLLESIGTLAANELFSPDGAGQAPGGAARNAEAEILAGIDLLARRCRHLVLVSEEVNSGGADYLGDTLCYLRLMGRLNQALAQRADRVYEAAAGLAIRRK